MATIEGIKELVAVAVDEDRGGRERYAAFQEADAGRKELKVGWSKLGLPVERVAELKEALPGLAELDGEDAGREDARAASEAGPSEAEPEASEEPGGTDGDETGASGGPAADDFEMTDDERAAQALRPKSDEEREAEAARVEAEHPMASGAPGRAAARVKRAKEEGAGETRGGLTRLVESLLMDASLSYLDIIKAVVAEFPKANTSARSIASVAAGMRRKGRDVPHRRPAKTEAAASVEQAVEEATQEPGEETLEEAQAVAEEQGLKTEA